MSNYSSNTSADDSNLPWSKIIEMIPPKSKVLDIGCSSGNLGQALIDEKNCTVVGIDLDAADIKIAQSKLKDAYVKNIETDDVSFLGTFDCVILADVIEHLVDPVRTLKKIQSLLNPNGVVYFSIPNMAHMATRLMLLDGRFVYGETGLLDKTHLHYYDRREVQRVFSDAGFDITNFDWSERYLPREVVKNQLNNLGLTPNEVFFLKNQETESCAYEFVGCAKPSKKSQPSVVPIPFVSPNVKPIEQQVEDARYLIEQKYIEKIEDLKEREDILLHNEAAIISSISWRITVPLRLLNGWVRRIYYRLKILKFGARHNPKWDITELKPQKFAGEQYAINRKTLREFDVKNSQAVIVHLHYPDVWPVIKKKLVVLRKQMNFDLFITMTQADKKLEESVRKDFNDAVMLLVPNRGRDVLPFLQTTAVLANRNYEYVLKIHSKKSPHRKDGGQWFNEILDELIPDDTFIFAQLQEILQKKETGIIGPVGQYIPLTVNYNANSYYLQKGLKQIVGSQITKNILDDRKEYGFFAGTMFWARVDALKEILEANFGPADFEKEKKRIDGTIAHAIERIFCLLPEFHNRMMFQIGTEKIAPISYKTNNIPAWSELSKKSNEFKRHSD